MELLPTTKASSKTALPSTISLEYSLSLTMNVTLPVTPSATLATISLPFTSTFMPDSFLTAGFDSSLTLNSTVKVWFL